MNCPRPECGAPTEDGVCHACGEGSKLSEFPDYEAGRLFDEWWRSIPKATMLEYGEAGTIQHRFEIWCAERATKQ